MADDVPEVFREFLRVFNEGRFWDSHEVLEAPWRTNGSDFYQGLILFASAWVHAGRGNSHGVRAQLAKAESKLARYRPGYLGIDLDRLLASCEALRRSLAGGTRPEPPVIRVDQSLIRGCEPELAGR